ncbi:hypothetical protein BDR26DRAFT_867731 [Obelidium mucronatum]|nr:hypothetical protein BDR26DRAFT_867731 [Obelidium mucronatum]
MDETTQLAGDRGHSHGEWHRHRGKFGRPHRFPMNEVLETEASLGQVPNSSATEATNLPAPVPASDPEQSVAQLQGDLPTAVSPLSQPDTTVTDIASTAAITSTAFSIEPLSSSSDSEASTALSSVETAAETTIYQLTTSLAQASSSNDTLTNNTPPAYIPISAASLAGIIVGCILLLLSAAIVAIQLRRRHSQSSKINPANFDTLDTFTKGFPGKQRAPTIKNKKETVAPMPPAALHTRKNSAQFAAPPIPIQNFQTRSAPMQQAYNNVNRLEPYDNIPRPSTETTGYSNIINDYSHHPTIHLLPRHYTVQSTFSDLSQTDTAISTSTNRPLKKKPAPINTGSKVVSYDPSWTMRTEYNAKGSDDSSNRDSRLNQSTMPRDGDSLYTKATVRESRISSSGWDDTIKSTRRESENRDTVLDSRRGDRGSWN